MIKWFETQLFGQWIQSDGPLSKDSRPGTGIRPDLTVTTRNHAEPCRLHALEHLIYSSPTKTDGGENILHLYRSPDGDLLRFAHAVAFLITRTRVICYDPLHQGALSRSLFMGPIITYWLELYRGYPVLHGAAVQMDGYTIGLLGESGAGKSTLTACLLQGGWTLISDDLLPVRTEDGRILTVAGHRRMRLCEDTYHYVSQHLTVDTLFVDPQPQLDEKILVELDPAPTEGSPQWHTLHGLYLLQPDRTGQANFAKLKAYSSQEALIALIALSFMPRITATLGLQRKRLDVLSSMVDQVPVKAFSVPRSFDRLASTCQVLVNDLPTLSD